MVVQQGNKRAALLFNYGLHGQQQLHTHAAFFCAALSCTHMLLQHSGLYGCMSISLYDDGSLYTNAFRHMCCCSTRHWALHLLHTWCASQACGAKRAR